MRRLNAWVPVVAVCVAIFLFSADAHSYTHSDALLGWLLLGHWPRLQLWLDEPFRKLAHVMVYGLLGVVTYRAWVGPELRWCRRGEPGLGAASGVNAWLFCTLYAASDEFHQRFVPTRGPSLHDVALDSAAALAAVLMLAWLTRPASDWRHRAETSMI